MATVRQKVVVDRLRDMIINGAFKEGEHMQEMPLARLLGVSRTPIREALVILGHEGLLRYRPNRGYVVRGFKLNEVIDAFLVRETLEGLACRIVAERRMDADLEAELTEALLDGDQMLAQASTGEYLRRPWAKMNARFHRAILYATQNAALIDATERVLTFPFSSTLTIPWFDKGDTASYEMLQNSHREHHVIFEALKAPHPYRAEAAMKEHVARAIVSIQKLVSLPGIFTG